MASPIDAEQRAERLKERIYITFSALAVTLALIADGHATAGATAITLTVAVVATLLAVFVADVVSHITVHQALPDAVEWRHMASVSVGSVGVLVPPLLLIGAAGIGLLELLTALRIVVVVLVATLIVIGYLAVRRLKLPIGARLLVLLAEFVVGVIVIVLESLAH